MGFLLPISKESQNTTVRTRRAALLDSQRQVLERIASGAPLQESLETLVRLIEEQANDIRCSVLLADTEKLQLRFVAAPSMSKDFVEAVSPFLTIGPKQTGICGVAAFRQEPVYVRDISTDPGWGQFGEIAVRNGLRAIWSTPILSDENAVLGTFAMYYGEPRLPSPEHIQLIDMAVQMARVAIEAKRAEDGLRRGEDRLRLVIDTIPTMAWSVLPDGAVDFVNQRWLDYTGLSFQEALEKANHAIHPEDLPSVIKKWSVDMAAGKPCEYEMRLRRADGEYRWFLIRTVPLRDKQGNIVKWYGTSVDIEDRKRAEDALRESEFDLAAAQRVAQLGSWALDTSTNAVRWSEELYRIFDVEKTAFDGTQENFLSRVHPDDRTRVLQAKAAARSIGEPFEVEYRIQMRNGQLKHIREIGYARTDCAGAVSSLFGTAQDITERKQTENALRASAFQLQALSRRLVELQESERKELARELHDRIGQNLTALNINLKILGAALSSQASEDLRARLADSETLIETTTAAIGDVVSELRPPMLDDHGLVPALGWYSRQFSARTGISVAVRGLQSDERPAPEMEIALFRIAQEALNNVVKHARASRVEITLERSGSEYMMSVQDDGVGFNAVEEHTAWRPGLGMVTMRERAQAVGGRFEIHALSVSGTRLTVRVPA